MYKKAKKMNEAAIDCRLASICEDLLKVNKDAIFAISRKFVENSNGSFKSEVNGNKVIVSSKQIDSLIIPSCLNLVNKNGDFYLTIWCDDQELIRILYSHMSFEDGIINNKRIENLYLDLENDEEFKKTTAYI